MTGAEENQLRRWSESHAPAGSWTAARVKELLAERQELREQNRLLTREVIELRELVGELNIRCGEEADELRV